MRRLWAYILLAFTSIVLVGVSFTPILKNAKSNMDYQSSREIMFHVQSKDEGEESLTKEKMDEVSATMVERLSNQGVTRYEVDVQGDDTISIILSQDYEEQYSNIIKYMEFDGSFALSNSAGDYALADEFLVEGAKAALDTYNNYPCITLPVNVNDEKYKSVLEGAKGEGSKPETSGEGDEATETYYLYLWYGFKENMISTETDYANNENIIMKFRVEEDAENQYFPGTDDKLFSAVNLDRDNDGIASDTEKKVAFDTAHFYVNLLNASKLDVTIKHLGSKQVAPQIENIINLGNLSSVAFSATLIATLCSIVLVSLLLIYFYRLGAVSVIVTALITLLAGLASMVWLSAEFTTITVMAFIVLALASIACGVVYLTKLKDEAYRGRSLKKANLEAGKKSLLPILDINVVLIIIGAFCFILGGSGMRTFAVVTVMGGIASTVLNLLFLRGMMWLATNATSLQGKYQFFGIDGEKVPDLINEEKQTYFGPYADKDLTRNAKKVSIGGCIVLLATVVAMIVFGAVNGSIYAAKNPAHNNVMYFSTEMSETSEIDDSSIKKILDNTYVYKNLDGKFDVLTEEEKASAKSLSSFGVASIDNNNKQYSIGDDDDKTTYYLHIVTFSKEIDTSLSAYYQYSDTEFITESTYDVNNVNNILNFTIQEKGILESVATVSLKDVRVYENGQPSVFSIGMASLIGAAVAGLYLLLRYRLSRGLAATILAISAGAIALGMLSLIHLPVVGGYVAVIAPACAFVTYVMAILFMNRERELILDDKKRDSSLENRKAITVKATSYSYAAIGTFAFLAIFIGISFFGFGPNATALHYVGYVLTLLVAIVVVPIVIGPLSNLFYKLFSGVKISKPSKKKKKTKVRKVNKSAEPEEAIFIGIND